MNATDAYEFQPVRYNMIFNHSVVADQRFEVQEHKIFIMGREYIVSVESVSPNTA